MNASAVPRSWWHLPVKPPRAPRARHVGVLWVCAAFFVACVFMLWLMFAMCWYTAVAMAWVFVLMWQGAVLLWRGLGRGVHRAGAAVADHID